MISNLRESKYMYIVNICGSSVILDRQAEHMKISLQKERRIKLK